MRKIELYYFIELFPIFSYFLSFDKYCFTCIVIFRIFVFKNLKGKKYGTNQFQRSNGKIRYNKAKPVLFEER